MKTFSLRLFSLLVLCISFACAKQNQSKNTDVMINIKNIAESKYPQKAVNYTSNQDSTYILCSTELKGTAQVPQNKIEYFVALIKTGEIVLEGNLMGGSVQWYDAEHLEIFRIPGIMAQGQTADDYTEIFNVKTKSSVQKSSFSKY